MFEIKNLRELQSGDHDSLLGGLLGRTYVLMDNIDKARQTDLILLFVILYLPF